MALEWSTACPDWEKRIVAGRSLIPFAPLFPAQAAAGLSVFDELKIVDVPGSPTMGNASRPWIRDFVATLFGSCDPDTGRRLITEYLLCVSKKNSKSTLAAGIMLTALILNWRQSAEFLILSPTIEIANNSFYPARDMVRADAELSALFQVQDHYRTITHRGTGSTLKVVAAENDTVGGKKATGVLVDELWLFGKRAGAENMLREACGGLASRPEGFTIFLTTQSDEPPAGVFRQKLLYARGVRDGRIEDPQFLPLLYEFPKEINPRDPANFHITNPNLGASVSVDFIKRELSKAEESGEDSVRGVLSKHLNVEIGLALQSDRWAGADFWEPQAAGVTLERILEECEIIDVGVDGGGLDDLLGLAIIGRHAVTRRWLAWFRAWAHPSVLERRKDVSPRLRDFARDGDLVLVERIGDDVTEAAELVGRCEKAGKLDKVGVDPYGLGGILDALAAAGVPEDKVIGVSQGWKLGGAIKTAERKLAEGEMEHSGSPLMAWCVGNARVEPKGNSILITKQASGTAKIDPLMAGFNAVTLLALNPAAPKPKKFQMIIV